MARQVNGGTPDNRLPCFYDAVLDCPGSPAIILPAVELAVREPADWLLRGHGFLRRLPVVCFKPTLRDQKLPQGKNLVAQRMVGASSCFILVFTRNRHSSNLFRKDRYLSRGNNIVDS